MSQAKPNCSRIEPSELDRLSLCDGDVLIELGERRIESSLLMPKAAANKTERSSRCGTVVRVGPGADFAVGEFVWFNRRRAETFSVQHADRGTVIYLLLTNRFSAPRLTDGRGRPLPKAEVERLYLPKVYAKRVGGRVVAVGDHVIVQREPSPDESMLVKVQADKQEKSTFGVVLDVGHIVGEIAVGDRVAFSQWAGNEMEGGLLALAEGEVLAVMAEA